HPAPVRAYGRKAQRQLGSVVQPGAGAAERRVMAAERDHGARLCCHSRLHHLGATNPGRPRRYSHLGRSLIASLLLVIDMPFAPLWGAFSDRVGRRRPFVILAFAVYLLGSLTVPFLAQTHSVAALVLTIGGMGIGCAMFFPAALTIPAETVTPDRAGAAYGLFFTAQVAGMLVGPMTIGQILDAATPLLAFPGLSAITAGGLALAFALRSR